MRVFLFSDYLVRHFGPGIHLVMISRELARLGHEPAVFIENPVPPENQYLVALRAAGVWTYVPSSAAVKADKWSRTNELLLLLLLPLRLVLTLLDMAVRRQGVSRSYAAVRGRLNRYLPCRQVIHPLRKALFKAMTAEHRRKPANVVHTLAGCGSVFDWAARNDVALVYNENSVPTDRFDLGWWADVMRHMERVDLVVALTPAAEPQIRRLLGYAGPVHFIPCMADDPWPEAVNPTTVAGSTNSRVIAGTASRLSNEKGHDVLLRALAQCLSALPDGDLILWIAGDGPARPSLEELAQRLNLGTHVRFLGHCDPGQLASFWQQIDFFVLPSLLESIPTVVIEAMANGKAVITTDVGGAREAVRDQESGLLVPAGSVDELARAIARLASSPEQRGSMGRCARQAYETHYRPDLLVDKYLLAYRSAISGRAALGSS